MDENTKIVIRRIVVFISSLLAFIGVVFGIIEYLDKSVPSIVFEDLSKMEKLASIEYSEEGLRTKHGKDLIIEIVDIEEGYAAKYKRNNDDWKDVNNNKFKITHSKNSIITIRISPVDNLVRTEVKSLPERTGNGECFVRNKTYNTENPAEIVATPNDDSIFVGWYRSENDLFPFSNDNPLTIDGGENTTVYANFELKDHHIKWTAPENRIYIRGDLPGVTWDRISNETMMRVTGYGFTGLVKIDNLLANKQFRFGSKDYIKVDAGSKSGKIETIGINEKIVTAILFEKNTMKEEILLPKNFRFEHLVSGVITITRPNRI